MDKIWRRKYSNVSFGRLGHSNLRKKNFTCYLSNRHWVFLLLYKWNSFFWNYGKNLIWIWRSWYLLGYFYISRNKLFSFIYLIKWYTWIISWGKYISMTFLKAKRCLTFNFMSIMKPSDHVRFWEAFVFHSTIDLKSYNRKNSVAIVTNNQRELQNLYDNIRFSIFTF